ncbi:hypothetical protein D3OALGB2SA_4143 [Olavius algarvensis associated proteobacterium Delta 3]|nr:hypothetical protein D3OALGB2SA_4143 [Olavius algarvensis associated proteobacterium Delta 3]
MTEDRGQLTDVRGRMSEVGGQRADVRGLPVRLRRINLWRVGGQRAEERCRVSGFRGQGSELKAEGLKMKRTDASCRIQDAPKRDRELIDR